MARSKAVRDPWPRQRLGIGAVFRDHLRVSRDTLHFVSARLGTSLLVWLLVGIALALPAGLFLLQVNLAGMSGAWEGRPGLSVYFKLDASDVGIQRVVDRLEAEPAVQAVTFISRERALAEFQSYAGLNDALELLDDNPLPASARAILVSGSSLDDLQKLADLATAEPAVAEVSVEKTWLERVTEITRIVSRLGVMLGVLFAVGAVLVTATSVRLAIEARLEELRVLKLVGATDRQIRQPFLYFGAFYGLGGGLVAAMLISLSLLIIERPLTNLLGSYGQNLQLAGFDPTFLGALFAVGGLLGILGALLAAKQRLGDLEVL